MEPCRLAVIGFGQRGYTYAAMISRTPGPELAALCDSDPERSAAFARELGLECRELILRRKNGLPQARLNRRGRERNLRDTFVPADKIHSPVLLVDDVLTTGTTALRCIEALREGGAKDITVLTMTRADS